MELHPQPLVKLEVILSATLKALGPVRLVPLIDPADRALWNEYVERYHYLGYKRPFGYRQRYFIESGGHWLGCILLSIIFMLSCRKKGRLADRLE